MENEENCIVEDLEVLEVLELTDNKDNDTLPSSNDLQILSNTEVEESKESHTNTTETNYEISNFNEKNECYNSTNTEKPPKEIDDQENNKGDMSLYSKSNSTNENKEVFSSQKTDPDCLKVCESENVESSCFSEIENKIVEEKANNESDCEVLENSDNRLLDTRISKNTSINAPITLPSISDKIEIMDTSENEETLRKNGSNTVESNKKNEINGATCKNQECERKNLSPLVHNQVQCVNLHCQSGFNLAEAPVFVLTYFGVERRKNVLQRVCEECFNIALKHQEKLCSLLKNNIPLITAEFPSQKDDVVVMDSVEEIYEEETLPNSVIEMVEKDLMNLIKSAVDKYNFNYQLEAAENVLTKKYDDLIGFGKEISDELTSLENQVKEARKEIYKTFTPRFKSLQPLNIYEVNGKTTRSTQTKKPSQGVNEQMKSKTTRSTSKLQQPAIKHSPSESNDVVALKQVEVPNPVTLPPIGKLAYPLLYAGVLVYVMKASFFGVWLKARVIEIMFQQENGAPSYRVRLECAYRAGPTKVVTGKQIAYAKPSRTRYPVGTRVIALFRNSEASGKDAYYAGVIAEPPKILNKFRYLVFFDDGYAQYVPHEKILLISEVSKFVHEDVDPESRDFIKSYLDQYPERPMVKLQKGQIVKTEWNGKWWIARVVAVDGSLAKMHFDADNRTEWIYRGSTRLGPLYSELVAAAARKEQGALSRHRSLGISSLKKRNMPYVEYSVDQDDVKSTQVSTASKNVAKKSTASKPTSQVENFSNRPARPLKPNEKVEYATKGYNRTVKLTGRIIGRQFSRHQCCFSCMEWVKFEKKNYPGINPLAVPLLYGFERQFAISKNKKTVFYRAPCGRRLRNIVEMYRYLRLTRSKMGLDWFDFDPRIRVLQEFHLEPNMYCTIVKDISYGHENTPVSCVNEINHTWPSFMDYSTRRIPQEGVNICLDEEFLVCCSCTDDCQDKEKCECWQLTIEGTKLGPTGQADPNAGYYYKRLLEPVTTGIYECNNRCKCGVTCLNRVAQYPLQLNLQVFKTLRKGWGLRALNDIPQGGFICIYAGRLHTEQGANDDGRMYGDEYLAELDYIEVIERIKEGYESEVIEPEEEKDAKKSDEEGDDCPDEPDNDESQMNSDDIDYVPEGLDRIPHTENVVTTRNRNRKITIEEKSESEGEKEKEEDTDNDKESLVIDDDDDDDEMKKKPSKFSADMSVNNESPRKYKSVREMFGDGADDCYIMDAKSCGNIGRYLNHSCQPNVFVQNVFVDTHDVRFPWVAFFALTYIKAGTELTWDYNYDIGSVPGKVLYCYCNSAECRGRLL